MTPNADEQQAGFTVADEMPTRSPGHAGATDSGLNEPDSGVREPVSRPALTGVAPSGEAVEAHPWSASRAEFLLHRLLAGSDVIAVSFAAVFAAFLVAESHREVDVGLYVLTLGLMIPVWFGIAYGGGLYHEVDRRIDLNAVDEIGPISIAATAWCWLFVLLRALIVEGGTDLLTPAVMWLMMAPLLLLFRSAVRTWARSRDWYRRPVAVIGEPAGVLLMVDRFQRHREWGLDVEVQIEICPAGGIIVRDSKGLEQAEPFGVATGLFAGGLEGREREMSEALDTAGVARAVIAVGSQELASRNRLVQELLERGIAVDQVSGGPETLYRNAVFHNLEGVPVLSLRPSTISQIAVRTKRLIDILISGIGLILTAPLLLWAAIWIKKDSPGPVFYRQARCGLDNREFQLVKLRTMYQDAHSERSGLRRATIDQGNDDVLFKLEDDPRMTRAGRFLRRTSIDELPQLWNVLKGDMSIVGPRPLVFEEALQATDVYAARTSMRPGITGPWQALGRSSIPFRDMVRLDYAYVMGWSLTEDVRLMLRTVNSVVRREGAA